MWTKQKQQEYMKKYYKKHREEILARMRTGRPPGAPRTHPIERIFAKVEINPDGCWLYNGFKLRGYGRIHMPGKSPQQAHRVVFEWIRGEIPKGLQLDHLCKVTNCVNPDHLEAVTPRENTMRSNSWAALNALKMHCPRGHEFTEANTYTYKGHRACRRCRTETTERYRQIHGR